MDRKQIVLRENWKFYLEEPRSFGTGEAEKTEAVRKSGEMQETGAERKSGNVQETGAERKSGEVQEIGAVQEYPRQDVWTAWYKGYDDSKWRTVTVPHDWSVEQPFSREYSSGTGYLTGGIGWYRLHFSLPEEYRGKSVRVVFDGVYKNSQVWCNSYYLGRRPYGYSSFSYDITHAAAFGDTENVLCVKVTHTDLADSRWFTGSGITRKVTLVVEERIHPAEYGVFFRAEKVEADPADPAPSVGRAEIAVTHRTAISEGLPGDKAQEAGDTAGPVVRIRTTLENAEGETVLTMEGETVPGGECTLTGTLERANLWAPEHPYLYRMRTWYRVSKPAGSEAVSGDNEVENTMLWDAEPEKAVAEREAAEGSVSNCDVSKPEAVEGDSSRCTLVSGRDDGYYLTDETWVGIRSIEFHSGKGFFLNGAETKLKGVCVHHDGGALGAAMEPEVWQRRLAALKEGGCNAIRCSHNPHMPELYELCDKMGFLMMDEAFDEWENAKNKWSRGHNVYPPVHQGYFEEFPQWYEADLRAMVGRDRNHPSVILWSIGNEIDYPNDPYCHPSFASMTGNNDANKPEAERKYDDSKPNALRLVTIAEKLERIVRDEDPTRPVTLAAAYPELSAETGLFRGLDVVGYNYKEHLYEKDHARFPEKPLLGSENGHGYGAWLAVKENPYISGQFLWTGIDYLGEAAGWPVHGSPAGILDCAGGRKPEFYRRKSFWSQEPMIALATMPVSKGPKRWRPMESHWNYQEEEEILVKVYSNLPEVRLLLNGQELGRLTEYNGDGEYCFQVKYKPGTLTAEGYGKRKAGERICNGEPVVTCSLYTSGKAEKLSCQVWQQQDALTGQVWETVSKEPGYLYQLEITLEDAAGKTVSWQVQEVAVEVEGAGELVGLENGNLGDVTPYCTNVRTAFRGRVLAYVRRKAAGEIKVRISMGDVTLTERLEG